MKLLDRFSVLLFDMGGTFMFGADRFGVDEDFYTTYRNLGGATLACSQVSVAIRSCYDAMLLLYQSPERYDDFPSLAEALREYTDVPGSELPRLEQVFALHERGSIPPDYAALLRRLSKTHQLGLVSNVWARKEIWLSEFERAGIFDAFKCQVFSSDSRSIKPSHRLFHRALQSFPADSRVLFIGDSLERDIVPAKALGLATAWIKAPAEVSRCADYVLPNLLSIEARTAKTAPGQRPSPAAAR